MARKKTTEIVAEILKPFLAENGYELYHTEFVREGRDWFLRVFIDAAQEEGEQRYIGTEDCEKVSRYLSDQLDQADPIEQNYYLEVSSPGLDRILHTEEHYRRYTGSQVDLKLYRAVDGSKEISGILKEFDGEKLIIETEDAALELKLTDIAKAQLAVVL